MSAYSGQVLGNRTEKLTFSEAQNKYRNGSVHSVKNSGYYAPTENGEPFKAQVAGTSLVTIRKMRNGKVLRYELVVKFRALKNGYEFFRPVILSSL